MFFGRSLKKFCEFNGYSNFSVNCFHEIFFQVRLKFRFPQCKVVWRFFHEFNDFQLISNLFRIKCCRQFFSQQSTRDKMMMLLTARFIDRSIQLFKTRNCLIPGRWRGPWANCMQSWVPQWPIISIFSNPCWKFQFHSHENCCKGSQEVSTDSPTDKSFYLESRLLHSFCIQMYDFHVSPRAPNWQQNTC